MTGMGTDMCDIPENIDHNYYIMAYHKDVTGEILNTVPSQPNLLITHKNSMYMSGFWDGLSGALSWRLLNMGDGSDILTTTTTTSTTTTTTSTKPADTFYEYQLTLKTGSDELTSCLVTMSNPSTTATLPSVQKIAYNQWDVQFTARAQIASNWTLNVSGTDKSGNTRSATTSVTFTKNGSYMQATNVNVALLMVKPGLDGDFSVNPLSLDEPEDTGDTNSLDDVINDYLNEG